MIYYRLSKESPFKEASPDFLFGLALTNGYYKVRWVRDSKDNIYLSPTKERAIEKWQVIDLLDKVVSGQANQAEKNTLIVQVDFLYDTAKERSTDALRLLAHCTELAEVNAQLVEEIRAIKQADA